MGNRASVEEQMAQKIDIPYQVCMKWMNYHTTFSTKAPARVKYLNELCLNDRYLKVLEFFNCAQVAMYNRNFSESTPASDLPCMNCLRVEMGERACYTGQTVKVPHFAFRGG